MKGPLQKTCFYEQVDLGTPVTWFAQVKGKNRIRLVPRTPCNSTCSTLYTVLHEGEIGK